MKDLNQIFKEHFVTLSVMFTILLCIIISLIYSSVNKKNIFIENRTPDSLSFQPSEIKTELNEDSTVNVVVNMDESVKVQGYNLKFYFDKKKINISNIDFTVGKPCSGLSDTTSNLENINSTGELHICGEVQSSTGEVINIGKQNLLNIKFVSIAAGESQFKFDSSSDNSLYTIQNTGAIERKPLDIQSTLNIL